jgi:hypothetical protein
MYDARLEEVCAVRGKGMGTEAMVELRVLWVVLDRLDRHWTGTRQVLVIRRTHEVAR